MKDVAPCSHFSNPVGSRPWYIPNKVSSMKGGREGGCLYYDYLIWRVCPRNTRLCLFRRSRMIFMVDAYSNLRNKWEWYPCEDWRTASAVQTAPLLFLNFAFLLKYTLTSFHINIGIINFLHNLGRRYWVMPYEYKTKGRGINFIDVNFVHVTVARALPYVQRVS